MAKLIAKTYGDALFEVGMEKDIVDSLREEVKAVSDLLDQNKEVKQYHHIGVVFVTTPVELKKIQKTAIEKKILATTEYESLEMNYQLDPSLIGGMVIRIGDRVVDGSIKTKLDKLSRELGKIQLT